MSVLLNNAIAISEWCKKYAENKPEWEWKLPSYDAEDYEGKLGRALHTIKTKVMNKYKNIPLDEIYNEDDYEVVQKIREVEAKYGKSFREKTILEINDWCQKRFNGKPIWERRLPVASSEDEYEKKLGERLHNIRMKLQRKYKGKTLATIDDEEDKRIIQMNILLEKKYAYGVGQKYYSLGKLQEIEIWCEANAEGKHVWERKLPNAYSKDEYEKNLASTVAAIKAKYLKGNIDRKLEDIEDPVTREIVSRARKLKEEYGMGGSLKNALEIKAWVKANNRLPSKDSLDEYEQKLARSINTIKSNILIRYNGIGIDYIHGDDQKTVEIMRKMGVEYKPHNGKSQKDEEER